VVRWLFQNVLITGDNVRLCVQAPVIGAMLPVHAGVALDAGCGSGEYTRALLLPRADYVAAMDFNPESLGRLQSRLGPKEGGKCALVNGSLTRLPFADGSFDTALCTEVIEHIEDDASAVRELCRVLCPGGTLIVSVPVPPPAIEDPAHVREGYTPEQMRLLLEHNGFTVTTHRTCMFALSRRALRLMSWSSQRLHVPPPLMVLCWIERLLGAGAPGRDLPFDVVVAAIKKPRA
jgi:ubiquinone/menaquinone biosynthesis C-methylase UbiE